MPFLQPGNPDTSDSQHQWKALGRTLEQIYRRSRTFIERTGIDYLRGGLTTRQIRRWGSLATQGETHLLERRVAFGGLGSASILEPLDSGKTPFGTDGPEWLVILALAMQGTHVCTARARARGVDADERQIDNDRVVVREIWDRFIDAAKTVLAARVGHLYGNFSEDAHRKLEDDLFESLCHASRSVLDFEYQIFRSSIHSTASCLHKSNRPFDLESFREFVRTRPLLSLFEEYPMLARLVGTIISSWIDTNQELITRLHNDWEELQRTFALGDKLHVAGITPALSDRHHGGRSVMRLEFDSGIQILYKPRSLGIELAYNKFLEWLNENLLDLKLRTFRVVDCGTHGWTEFVSTNEPCGGDEEGRYFYRCGELLCVAHILRATDLHAENLVQHGEHPVLVDLETLMHPAVRCELPEDPTLSPTVLQEWNSVLRTALLPLFDMERSEQGWARAGLTGSLRNCGERAERATRVPCQLPADEHWRHVVDGFQSTYRALLNHRDVLVGPDSPLRVFTGREIRFVFRSTAIYLRLSQLALQPGSLRDGTDFGIELERLSQIGTRFPVRPAFWPLVQAEQEALTHFDVPHFRTFTDVVHVSTSPTTTIPSFFVQSGMDEVRTFLQHLSEADLDEQVGRIVGSLHSPSICLLEQATKARVENFSAEAPRTYGYLLNEAVEIGEELSRRRISFRGRAIWIAPQLDSRGTLSQPLPVPRNFYAGGYGIALFYAALFRVTGEQRFASEARNALPEFRTELCTPTDSGPEIGACCGLGSIVYGLTRVGQLLDMPELYLYACQAAAQLTDQIIRSDHRFDVFWGSAGAILGLLALYGETRESWVLERAIRCGRHLLDHQATQPSSGFRECATGGRSRVGFAHGAAGIVHALLRLYSFTGDRLLVEVARDAMAVERAVFVPDARYWEPELLTIEWKQKNLFNTWCRGGPGIGLSRLGALDALDSQDTRTDIEIAIQAVLEQPLQDIDHLCCGNMGALELLLAAGTKLSRRELINEASARATQVVIRAGERGAFGYSLPAFNPGLFQGAAGIGYELLRLTDPESVPCVLLWD